MLNMLLAVFKAMWVGVGARTHTHTHTYMYMYCITHIHTYCRQTLCLVFPLVLEFFTVFAFDFKSSILEILDTSILGRKHAQIGQKQEAFGQC